MPEKRKPSIADIEKAQNNAEAAHEQSVIERKKLEEIKNEFEKIKNDPEIVIKLAIIKELEWKRRKTSQGKSLDEIEDASEAYNDIIRALKLNPEDSLTASILDTIIKIARNTKIQ